MNSNIGHIPLSIMSLPTTPSRSLPDEAKSQASPVLSSPSGKRKQAAVDAYQQVSSAAQELLEGDGNVPPALRDALQNFITALDVLPGFKRLKPEPPALPASSIQLITDAVSFFGLEYSDADPEFVWDISDAGSPISLSPETGNLFLSSPFLFPDHEATILIHVNVIRKGLIQDAPC